MGVLNQMDYSKHKSEIGELEKTNETVDTPKVYKRILNENDLKNRERDINAVLENYEENLRNLGVNDDTAIERFKETEREKMLKELESADLGNTSENIYYTPDFEKVAAAIKSNTYLEDLNKYDDKDLIEKHLSSIKGEKTDIEENPESNEKADDSDKSNLVSSEKYTDPDKDLFKLFDKDGLLKENMDETSTDDIDEPVRDEDFSEPTEDDMYGETGETIFDKLSSPELFEKNEKGSYTYLEDEHGKTAYGQLVLEKGERDLKAQREAGGEDRRETDDGGHSIGTRFNGSSGYENLTAQDRSLNRGAYKQMENKWANSLEKGEPVFVNIDAYSANKSDRPDAYMGYSITEHKNGKRELDAFSFQNLTKEEQEKMEEIINETDIPDEDDNPKDYDPKDYSNELDEEGED